MRERAFQDANVSSADQLLSAWIVGVCSRHCASGRIDAPDAAVWASCSGRWSTTGRRCRSRGRSATGSGGGHAEQPWWSSSSRARRPCYWAARCRPAHAVPGRFRRVLALEDGVHGLGAGDYWFGAGGSGRLPNQRRILKARSLRTSLPNSATAMIVSATRTSAVAMISPSRWLSMPMPKGVPSEAAPVTAGRQGTRSGAGGDEVAETRASSPLPP
jgi:hypothetical protein